MRGITLIEMMICVAIIGILSALGGLSTAHLRMNARAELQQEQALLLLEHHVDHLSRGTQPRADVAERLLATLPAARLEVERGRVTTVTLSWLDPFGRPSQRALATFEPGRTP